MARRTSNEPSSRFDDRVAALRGVGARFGAVTVLRDVDLAIERGSHWEVRGANGSGKTTLLRVLAGTCPPSSGHRDAVRPVAFVPAALEPPALSVQAWARSVRPRRGSFDEALDVLGFVGDRSRSFRRLSYGNFRKVLLADALSSDSALVVVDEAREGLDDAGLQGLDRLVRGRCTDGGAVVVADQAAHRVPDGAHHVIVRGGSVDEAPGIGIGIGTDIGEVTISFLGPAGRAAQLADEATRLGFRPSSEG